MDENYLTPSIFTRHKLPLHALLIQNQPWFCARDLSRRLTSTSTNACCENSTPTNTRPADP